VTDDKPSSKDHLKYTPDPKFCDRGASGRPPPGIMYLSPSREFTLHRTRKSLPASSSSTGGGGGAGTSIADIDAMAGRSKGRSLSSGYPTLPGPVPTAPVTLLDLPTIPALYYTHSGVAPSDPVTVARPILKTPSAPPESSLRPPPTVSRDDDRPVGGSSAGKAKAWVGVV